MKLSIQIFAVCFFMLLLSGCSLFSPAINEVNYYDLDFKGTKTYETDCVFVYRSFQNISPARMNFLYTAENSVIEIDQYNFWVQSPEVMIRRYMLNAVRNSNSPSARQLELSLTVFDFEFDIAGKKAVLGINCIVRDVASGKKVEKNYTVETPVGTLERLAFVDGMNQCVDKFIQKAIEDIKKL